MTVSEGDVALQQVEEDLRVYGSRPEPPDDVDIDESTQLANLPPKRNASEFEAAVDRPATVRKAGEIKAFNYEAISAIGWNGGASPLDAWLNQSAIPSIAAAPQPSDLGNSEKDLIAQEEKEIKVFRNVHVEMAPSPEDETTVDELEGLNFSAQVYYRNIRDRYPLLPTYLARRLAQANYRRFERLRIQAHCAHTLRQDKTRGRQQFREGYIDFWIGEYSKPSAAFSMNSSLHGRPKFDPEEQNPVSLANHRRNSSASLVVSPAFPPPPVKLGKVLTFDCGICGQKIQVERQFEWQ